MTSHQTDLAQRAHNFLAKAYILLRTARSELSQWANERGAWAQPAATVFQCLGTIQEIS